MNSFHFLEYNVIGVTDNQISDGVTAVTYGTAQTGSFVANKIVNLAVDQKNELTKIFKKSYIRDIRLLKW
jgi:hypothetical protein